MLRGGAKVYRDNPYEHDVEFYQDVPFAEGFGPSPDSIVKGALVGAAAGIAAGFLMVQFQKLWAQALPELTQRQEDEETPKHRQAAQQEDGAGESDDATVKVAQRFSQGVFDHTLTDREKKIAGPAVHYGFSAATGAIYGAFAESVPLTTAGFGTLFGSVLFIGADEVAVPALKLSPPPHKVKADKHLYGLASHLVYGATLEGLRRALLRALR